MHSSLFYMEKKRKRWYSKLNHCLFLHCELKRTPSRRKEKVKIIIVGCGKVGEELAAVLSSEKKKKKKN